MAFGIQISAEYRGATESRCSGFLVGEKGCKVNGVTKRRSFISYDYAANDPRVAAVNAWIKRDYAGHVIDFRVDPFTIDGVRYFHVINEKDA